MAPFGMGPLAPGEPLFFVVGGIVLVGLIGLLFVLRNRRDED
jgi:LPXTG-motif cell wall-anchored protein